MEDSIKQGNILIMRELFEAFDYFYAGNNSIAIMASEINVAKKHYVKQDLGNKFMYNCKKYGVKFVNISNDIYKCDITSYHVRNDNEIVDSMMSFKYDFLTDSLISIDSLYTPYSSLSNEEALKVLYK